jgi:hypothetical protein
MKIETIDNIVAILSIAAVLVGTILMWGYLWSI